MNPKMQRKIGTKQNEENNSDIGQNDIVRISPKSQMYKNTGKSENNKDDIENDRIERIFEVTAFINSDFRSTRSIRTSR